MFFKIKFNKISKEGKENVLKATNTGLLVKSLIE